jgi:hypothetical protein
MYVKEHNFKRLEINKSILLCQENVYKLCNYVIRLLFSPRHAFLLYLLCLEDEKHQKTDQKREIPTPLDGLPGKFRRLVPVNRKIPVILPTVGFPEKPARQNMLLRSNLSAYSKRTSPTT